MPQGFIFNIQRYSIHDGPGIRTTVFLKGCPLRCFWCQNPESQAPNPEIFFDRSKCNSCARCISVCPAGASTMEGDRSSIDRRNCTGCGRCAETCPTGARRVIGQQLTPEEVMRQVLRDIRYYEHSGGGVTLSGGEPTAQPQFALAILQKCKEAGIHTALDMCGHAPWSRLKELLAYTDFVLLDIKHLEPHRHRKGTGKDNRLILENARRIFRSTPMRIRVPMIPGFNDSPEVVTAIARFAKMELGPVAVDLLPYNIMGEGKYALLGRNYAPLITQDEGHTADLRTELRRELGEGLDQDA